MNWFGGVEYRVRANQPGVTLNLILPGHNYQAERAVQDMIWLAWSDSRFSSCQPETISDFQWGRYSESFDFRQMTCAYEYSDGVTVAAIPIYHATSRRHQLFRWVGYYDPESGQWRGWQGLMPGSLDP